MHAISTCIIWTVINNTKTKQALKVVSTNVACIRRLMYKLWSRAHLKVVLANLWSLNMHIFKTFLKRQLLLSLPFFCLRIMCCNISSSYKGLTSCKWCKLQVSPSWSLQCPKVLGNIHNNEKTVRQHSKCSNAINN